MKINRVNITFIRFCMVGSVCAAIDWITFSLSNLLFPYQVSVVIGFTISYLVNFWLTSGWTFHKRPTKRKFVGMLSAHLINLFVVRVLVLMLLIEIVGIQENVAYIPTLILSAVTSFFMIRYVFK